MSARDLAATVRAIKDAIWEQGCEGFEGLPNARADSIIAWFADREAALEKQAADAQAERDEAQRIARVNAQGFDEHETRADRYEATASRLWAALRMIAESYEWVPYSDGERVEKPGSSSDWPLTNRAIARAALAYEKEDEETWKV